MAINLLDIQPHKVSKDLSGYITYIYGAGKTGKTTLASQMEDALLIAFEKGYNAIPGIKAIDVSTWGEFKQVVRELKKTEVKSVYKCIVIDTVDIASALCEKYVCSQNDVDKLSEIPYGGGWAIVKKEFEENFRTITQQGYALFFISHAKDKVFKREDGTEYNQIIPSLANTYNEIVKNMADIYGYAHQVRTESGTTVNLTLRSPDGSVDTGCRFKYIQPEIPFTYQALTEALNAAIDKEAELTDNKFVTSERASIISASKEREFSVIMTEFQSIAKALMDRDSNNAAVITATAEKYLGKGKKVSECTDKQGELVELIINDLKPLV